MDLSNLFQVEVLAKERAQLLQDANAVDAKTTNYLGVTLQGRYQDQAFVDGVRGLVTDILLSRVAKIDEKLKALGVSPSA